MLAAPQQGWHYGAIEVTADENIITSSADESNCHTGLHTGGELKLKCFYVEHLNKHPHWLLDYGLEYSFANY